MDDFAHWSAAAGQQIVCHVHTALIQVLRASPNLATARDPPLQCCNAQGWRRKQPDGSAVVPATVVVAAHVLRMRMTVWYVIAAK